MWSFFQFLDDDECIPTILDIGAAMTNVPSYQPLLDKRRARLIGFEPNIEACQRLKDHYGAPHRFFPYFLGDGLPAVFHETNKGPTGSLFEPNVPLLDKFHWLGEVTIPVARHEVATTRLDDIQGIGDVDFIKIDCQGAELAVFQNALRALNDAVLIQTEVSFVESYKGQPMFSDIDAFLRKNGFQFHDLLGFGERPFKPLLNPRHASTNPLLRSFRQRLWANVYYVKDWMRLDTIAPAKLKRMAALLHDIVESYDLAYLVLQALDKQIGSDIAAEYLGRLQQSGHAVLAPCERSGNLTNVSAEPTPGLRRVLNVGGNSKAISLPSIYDGWDHLLLDIDAQCSPDILCDAREMDRLPASWFDSIYCAHNLEHYYQHDVPKVLAGFRHVLKDDGFVWVRVPDIAAVMRSAMEMGLDINDVLYQSQMGPISVRDVIYGLGSEIERSGNDFFAHKTGFTEKSLAAAIHASGFSRIFTKTDSLEITALAFKTEPKKNLARLLGLSEMRVATGGAVSASHGGASDPSRSSDIFATEFAGPQYSLERRTPVILKTSDGLCFSVPGSLDCISTYVLLEQEKWFEREVVFLRRWFRPGMNAIDIGANIGVYCLPLAKVAGINGCVYAFEPGSGARSHLEAARLMNHLDSLHISPCALSDTEKVGSMQAGWSGELNSLSTAGPNSRLEEAVRVSSLDAQEQEFGWPSIDFIKIDAEGQEARIVAGGRSFFSRHSPLVMYEIKAGGNQAQSVRWTFEALGYRSYRLLGDASFLVPLESDEELDSYELNLFAAKPDRAESLALSGILAKDPIDFALSPNDRRTCISTLLALPYALAFEFSIDDIAQCPYGEALVAYAAYRNDGFTPSRRHAALKHAFTILDEYCRGCETPTALATFARVAGDLGLRRVSVDILKKLIKVSGIELHEPFLVPCERFEQLSPEGLESEWFVAAVNEQFELSRSHSSCFLRDELVRLQWLCDSPFSSPEIGRRLMLEAGRQGMGVEGMRAYVHPQHRHSNPEYWTAEGVPLLASLF